MDMAAVLNTRLMEIFRNHKLIKVFQKETYEASRANNALEQLKNKAKKISYNLCKIISNYGIFNRNYDCNFNLLLW